MSGPPIYTPGGRPRRYQYLDGIQHDGNPKIKVQKQTLPRAIWRLMRTWWRTR